MMFSPFERMVAKRYLRARKAEGFVSLIAAISFTGIMLGVATLIIVMAVMNGYRQDITKLIVGLNGHINVYTNAPPFVDYDIIGLKIADLDGITRAFPVIEGQALMTGHGVSRGVMVRGYKPADMLRKPVLGTSAVVGTFADLTEGKVAIGKDMAEQLQFQPGSKITLLSPTCKNSPFGCMPRSRSFEVGMIFDAGMFEYNSNFIFMPLESAQTFFQMPNAISSLEIITENPEKTDHYKKEIRALTGGLMRTYDWKDQNSSFMNALIVERNVMFIILTLIIIVAAFNILSSMFMLVKDKGHDIAIMRTMGATRKSMMKIFILTGASIGVLATVVGAILGIAFAANIETMRQWIEKTFDTSLFPPEVYFLSQLPSDINAHEVILVMIVAIFFSIVFTLYPAWRAARLDPVEALRYE